MIEFSVTQSIRRFRASHMATGWQCRYTRNHSLAPGGLVFRQVYGRCLWLEWPRFELPGSYIAEPWHQARSLTLSSLILQDWCWPSGFQSHTVAWPPCLPAHLSREWILQKNLLFSLLWRQSLLLAFLLFQKALSSAMQPFLLKPAAPCKWMKWRFIIIRTRGDYKMD